MNFRFVQTSFPFDVSCYKNIDLSPTDHIAAGAPPSIILVGTKDAIVPVDMVQSFKEKMEAVGSRCDLVLYKDQGHAFFAKKPIKYFIETRSRARALARSRARALARSRARALVRSCARALARLM